MWSSSRSLRESFAKTLPGLDVLDNIREHKNIFEVKQELARSGNCDSFLLAPSVRNLKEDAQSLPS